MSYEDVVDPTHRRSKRDKQDLYFASCDRCRILIWNVNSGRVILTLDSPSSWGVLIKLRYNETPGLFVSKSQSRGVHVWSIRNGKGNYVCSMESTHPDVEYPKCGVDALFELQDGRLVQISECFISVYDMRSYQCVQIRFLGYHGRVLGELEPGVVLLWFSLGGRVGAWDINTGAFNPNYLGHWNATAAALSPDMKTVVTSSTDALRFWRLSDRACVGEIKTSIAILIMTFLNRNTVVAGARFTPPAAALIDVEVPDTLTGSSSYSNKFIPFGGTSGVLKGLAALGDGSFLCGSSDITLTRWSTRGDCFQSFPLEHYTTVSLITVLDDNTFASLHVIESAGVIRTWCLRTGNCMTSFGVDVSNTRTAADVLVCLRKDFTLGLLRHNKIDVWGVEGVQIQSIRDDSSSEEESTLWCLCELDDGRLVTGTREGHIKVWSRGDNNNKGGCMQTLGRPVLRDAERFAVTKVVQAKKSPMTRFGEASSSLLVSCSWEGRVKVWDLEAGVSVVEFMHDTTPTTSSLRVPSSMTLLEDQAVICTAKESVIKTWDFEGRCLFNYFVHQPHRGFVTNLIEIKDGSLIVGFETGGLDAIRRPVR